MKYSQSIRIRNLVKRVGDIVFSFSLLLLLSPVFLGVALVIPIFCGTPILFRQKRPGLNGVPFSLYKFRTMDEKYDKFGVALPDSERLSPLGNRLRKLSLDELPQLINVLKGEMSFVGPRPLLMQYLPRYTPYQRRRHDVKPGLTGWAQVNGRNSINWERKFELDVWYVDHQSLWLDIKIIFKTLLCVFKSKGIAYGNHASAPEFQAPVSVIGGGGHAKVIIAGLKAAGEAIEGAYDNDASKWGSEILGVKILGGMDLLAYKSSWRAVIALGDNALRKQIAEDYHPEWVTVVHPNAFVEADVTLGAGTVVMAGAIIQSGTQIGSHCIINTGTTVDHDCQISNYVHLAPGCHLAGFVQVEEGAFLGVGTNVIPKMKIGRESLIGAGSTVVRSVEENTIAYGVPAKNKGKKKMSKVIPLKDSISMSGADIDEADVQAVADVVRSGRLALGPKTEEFEKQVREYVGVKHALAVSSGTAALHLILRAMGIGPGDEVLVPSYTFAASVNAILYDGAIPVFVEIEPETFCMDPHDAEKKITTRTKAILPVDIFGHPANWTALLELAKRKNLLVIDDACEALGATLNGKKVGSFGDAATFAFYPNKQITTGEGGIIVTNNDQLANTIASLRNQGRSDSGQWLVHERLGYNYRMDEMSAALGGTQMRRVDSILAKREKVARAYTERLRSVPGLRLPQVKPGATMSWFVYVVTLERGISREDVMQKLEAQSIPSRPYFSPIHEQPYMREYLRNTKVNLPITEDMGKRTLALPFYSTLSDEKINRVVESLESVLKSMTTDSAKQRRTG